MVHEAITSIKKCLQHVKGGANRLLPGICITLIGVYMYENKPLGMHFKRSFQELISNAFRNGIDFSTGRPPRNKIPHHRGLHLYFEDELLSYQMTAQTSCLVYYSMTYTQQYELTEWMVSELDGTNHFHTFRSELHEFSEKNNAFITFKFVGDGVYIIGVVVRQNPNVIRQAADHMNLLKTRIFAQNKT